MLGLVWYQELDATTSDAYSTQLPLAASSAASHFQGRCPVVRKCVHGGAPEYLRQLCVPVDGWTASLQVVNGYGLH